MTATAVTTKKSIVMIQRPRTHNMRRISSCPYSLKGSSLSYNNRAVRFNLRKSGSSRTLSDVRKAMWYKQADTLPRNTSNERFEMTTTTTTTSTSMEEDTKNIQSSAQDSSSSSPDTVDDYDYNFFWNHRRQQISQQCIDKILEEQIDQWENSRYDPEQLAKVSMAMSSQSQREALARGRRIVIDDEEEVEVDVVVQQKTTAQC